MSSFVEAVEVLTRLNPIDGSDNLSATTVPNGLQMVDFLSFDWSIPGTHRYAWMFHRRIGGRHMTA